MRIPRSGLPYERGYVIIYRAPSTSLKINKIRITILKHDIPGLKIPIEECRDIFTSSCDRKSAFYDIVGKTLEIFLKQHFMKLKSGRLKETILEIVQIEHHGMSTELFLGMAYIKIKSGSSLELYHRKHRHCPAKKIFHIL